MQAKLIARLADIVEPFRFINAIFYFYWLLCQIPLDVRDFNF